MPGAFLISLGYAWTCAAGVHYTKKSCHQFRQGFDLQPRSIWKLHTTNAQVFFSSFKINQIFFNDYQVVDNLTYLGVVSDFCSKCETHTTHHNSKLPWSPLCRVRPESPAHHQEAFLMPSWRRLPRCSLPGAISEERNPTKFGCFFILRTLFEKAVFLQ